MHATRVSRNQARSALLNFMIWFTSDLHLGHEKVIDFCNRPFANAGWMDDFLIRRYNERVHPDDTVYFLGDLSFHKPRFGIALLSVLRGRKILIRGNHDKYSDTQYRTAGFESILEEAKIRIKGHYFILSHYPYEPCDKTQCTEHDLRYLDRRPLNRGSWLLCGHVHDQWKASVGHSGKMINVGVDVWDYSPVSFSEIESFIAAGPSYNGNTARSDRADRGSIP